MQTWFTILCRLEVELKSFLLPSSENPLTLPRKARRSSRLELASIILPGAALIWAGAAKTGRFHWSLRHTLSSGEQAVHHLPESAVPRSRPNLARGGGVQVGKRCMHVIPPCPCPRSVTILKSHAAGGSHSPSRPCVGYVLRSFDIAVARLNRFARWDCLDCATPRQRPLANLC
jgi:hypothetical protein